MPALAQILRLHGPGYFKAREGRIPPHQRRAVRDILNCRTAACGGSLHACPSCPDTFLYSYHSCGNRACPKCQNDRATRWMEDQRALLLPVPYFLVTATLPDELRAVARDHPSTVYSAFFRAASRAILDLGALPKHLGGLAGFMGILQTWRRDLGFHPHIHFLVPAGVLSPDRTRWVRPRRPGYLLPERALAARIKLNLREELDAKGLLALVSPRAWKREKRWVADCLPVGTGEAALKYLAPYIYRTALCDSRIERLQDGKVTYRYTDAKSGKTTHPTVTAEAFLGLFLQHVLPAGFVRIRSYGFLATKNRSALLPKIREILRATESRCGAGGPVPEEAAEGETARRPEGHPFRCPKCGGEMFLAALIPRPSWGRAPPQPAPDAASGRAAA